MNWQLVLDKYNITKRFKNSSNYGKLCSPLVYKISDNEYIIKAETYSGCADVALIDYMTSDFHLFNTAEEALKAWTGKIPKTAGWNH